jgi:uncharacterized Zn finger protein
MEALAEASGDTDALVAVMSRDLSSPYGYLRIAETCRAAKRHADALNWAEKGLRAFPERADSRLRDFVADEYHRLRRHDDAVSLIWAGFLERPLLDSYQKLQRHAAKAKSWPEWRERALAEIRRRIGEAAKRAPQMMDHSSLVEIFLSESDTESAWREARAGGCSDRLWFQLAAAREKEHPEDSAPVYLRLAEGAIASVANGRYEDSVELLVKAARLMAQMGRAAEFAHSIESLRTKYRIKRNFIKLTERKRKALYLL